MFASRFDPTKVVVNITAAEDVSAKEVVLPLKRKREVVREDTKDGDESESESESTSESEDSEDNESSSESEADSEADSDNDSAQVSENPEIDTDKKHSSILNRFQQTLSLQSSLKTSEKVDSEAENEDEDVSMQDVHSLTPIPQPAKVRDNTLKLLDSTMYKSTAWDSATKINYDNSMIKPFESYKDELDSRLLKNIINNFSENTFPIQTILFDTILPILNSSFQINKTRFTRQVGDILVNASTGSGKTLAYSVPLVQILRNRTVNTVRAVILLPTKILIHQVYECISKLSQGTSLIVSMSKLENSLKEEHSKFLQNCPDILIITPGRLVDHLQMKSFDLKNLKFLVLDEADRLLNQSFQNWNKVLFQHLSAVKQDKRPGNIIKMIFSATLTTNAEKLYNLHLHNPKIFLTDSVKLYTMPKTLQELNLRIPTAKSLFKPLVLLRVINELKNLDNIKSNSKILVFVKSNESSIRLTSLIQVMLEAGLAGNDNISLASINSNNSKGTNKKLIQEFASSTQSKSVLISTDVMARGIDINEITHVINYDVPISSQQYVHRCGRTARATTEGIAINLLVGKGEHKFWSDHIDCDLSRDVDGYQPAPYKSDEETLQLLNLDEQQEANYKQCIKSLQLKNNDQSDSK